MKNKKIKSIILTTFSVVIVLGILFGLGFQIYLINYNYRKYEFKLTSNTIDILLGNNGTVPISLVNGNDLNYSDFSYISSDDSIITVDDNGKITTLNKGSAKLIIKAKKSIQQEMINVNVVLIGSSVEVEDIIIDREIVNLKVGESYTSRVEVVPSNASVNLFTWSSSNPSVASVVGGVIIAKNEGECIIYVKNGNIKKEIKVFVTRK